MGALLGLLALTSTAALLRWSLVDNSVIVIVVSGGGGGSALLPMSRTACRLRRARRCSGDVLVRTAWLVGCSMGPELPLQVADDGFRRAFGVAG